MPQRQQYQGRRLQQVCDCVPAVVGDPAVASVSGMNKRRVYQQ